MLPGDETRPLKPPTGGSSVTPSRTDQALALADKAIVNARSAIAMGHDVARRYQAERTIRERAEQDRDRLATALRRMLVSETVSGEPSPGQIAEAEYALAALSIP